ncbi:glycosyltransferase [Planktomarina temperata]|nr:glycosyltransferase [Planktomarina temperata]
MPKLVIGVPCYNERPYIRDCLRSLTNNDLTDVQIVVSDNGSTDGCLDEINETLTELPNEKNACVELQTRNETVSAAENFASVFDQTDSEYFLWVGAHDALTTNFLSSCIAEMDANPQASMVSGKALGTDTKTTKVVDLNIQYKFDSPDPLIRYLQSVKELSNCTVLHSIIRRSALDGFIFSEKCPSFDHIIISNLLWNGTLVYKEEAGYIRRYFDNENLQAKSIKGHYVNESNTSVFFNAYIENFERLIDGRYPEAIKGHLKGLLFNTLCQRFGLPNVMDEVA